MAGRPKKTTAGTTGVATSNAAVAVQAAVLSSHTIIDDALQHLRRADPKLAPLILEHGAPTSLLAKLDSCFPSLVRSIVYQQLATRAAAAIHGRLITACGVAADEMLQPSMLLAVPVPDLRACGLSERKAMYLRDLAEHFVSNHLGDDQLRTWDDATLLRELTLVKGIGAWTVDMFAMFHLGRPDVLPVGDLGVKKGMQHLYGLKAAPTPAEMEKLADSWRPYRSVGAWYMWRIVTPKAQASAKAGTKAAAKAAAAGVAPATAAATAAVASGSLLPPTTPPPGATATQSMALGSDNAGGQAAAGTLGLAVAAATASPAALGPTASPKRPAAVAAASPTRTRRRLVLHAAAAGTDARDAAGSINHPGATGAGQLPAAASATAKVRDLPAKPDDAGKPRRSSRHVAAQPSAMSAKSPGLVTPKARASKRAAV